MVQRPPYIGDALGSGLNEPPSGKLFPQGIAWLAAADLVTKIVDFESISLTANAFAIN
jgi:hypothetical protein